MNLISHSVLALVFAVVATGQSLQSSGVISRALVSQSSRPKRLSRQGNCTDNKFQCNNLPVVTPLTPPQSGSCRIPTIENGHVVATFSQMVVPPNDLVVNGQSVEFVCKVGNTNVSTYCVNGEFINELPRCTDGCSTLKLDTLSVQARCTDKRLIPIPCSAVVPETTFAVLECKTGYERPSGEWSERIFCLANGEWSGHVPRCEPKCGQITSGVPFISGGHVTNISQVPWHVAVYQRRGLGDDDEYDQICGGTIISQTAVISAAHCFWDETVDRLGDAALFSVIAGKSFRDYKLVEPGMQVMKVQEIRIQDGYLGNSNQFIADIAVLRLTKPIIYQTFIVPICLKFLQFAAKNVPTGTKGRVAGYGIRITEENVSSAALKVVDIDAVDYTTCSTQSEESFRPYILPDKFCATRANENVCQGDSGGGFMEEERTADGSVRYYLRGLVSVGSKLGQIECRANRTYTTFTNVLYYEGLFYEFTQV